MGAGIVNTVCADCGSNVDPASDIGRLAQLKYCRVLCAVCYRNSRASMQREREDLLTEMGSYLRSPMVIDPPDALLGEVHLPLAEDAEPLVFQPNETKPLSYAEAVLLAERLASLKYQLAKETKARRFLEGQYAEIFAALENLTTREPVEESRVLAVMRATLCGLLGWPEEDVAQLAESLYYIATAHEPISLRHVIEQRVGPVPPPPF